MWLGHAKVTTLAVCVQYTYITVVKWSICYVTEEILSFTSDIGSTLVPHLHKEGGMVEGVFLGSSYLIYEKKRFHSQVCNPPPPRPTPMS